MQYACLGEEFDFDKISDEVNIKNTNIILPIINADITIKDILGNNVDEVKYGKDGSVHVIIRNDTVNAVGFDDFFKLEIESLSFDNLPLSIFNFAPTLNVGIPKLKVKTRGIDLSMLIFDYKLNVEYSGFYNEEVMEIKFTSANSESNVLKHKIELGNKGKKVIDIKSGEMVFPVKVDASFYQVEEKPYENNDKGSLKIYFSDFNVKTIRGKILNEIELDTVFSELNVDDFDKYSDYLEKIKFDSISLTTVITNRSELNCVIDPFIGAFKDNRKEKKELKFKYNKANLIYANSSKNGVERITYNTFDDNKANLSEFINWMPDEMYFGGILNIDTKGEDILVNSNDSIFMGFNLDIPMDFSTNARFEFDDEIKLNSGITEMLHNIKDNVELIISTENEFPLEIGINILLLDDNARTGRNPDGLIDNIEVKKIIKSAKVNDIGVSINTIKKRRVVKLTQRQIKNLKNTDRVKFEIITKTAENNIVRLRDTNKLKFLVAVISSVNIND